MTRGSRTVGLYLSLVFLSGALVGGFGHWLYAAKTVQANPPRSNETFRQRYVKEHVSRLKLDDAQKAALISILDEFHSRYKEVRDRMEPEMQRIQNEQRAKIRATLRPDQSEEYSKMLAERDSKQKK